MADVKIYSIQKEICEVIKGKEEIVEKVLAVIFAGGHILLDDIPGVGKTTLAMSIAHAMSLDYKRVQFTPDVLPSDIVGFSMYNSATKEFEYKQGTVFCNLFLADEINRTSPKTQSALLEVMEEGNVTVDGITHKLPVPFTVIATENPVGSSGTQLLPESQLDRFMVCLSLGYPGHADSIEILRNVVNPPINDIHPVISPDELLFIRKTVDEIHVDESILDYITTLVEATRNSEYISLGSSPRGAINLLKLSKAVALMNDHDYVTPSDIRFIFCDVLRHRIRLGSKAKAEGLSADDVLNKIFCSVPVPKGN
ncbi:MAG: MoxR family ATPase [Thermoflexaceae bacterium]|nr:MoxR family ATPase [Thermoflexaceae bacterium]